jgi:hypothetical protein
MGIPMGLSIKNAEVETRFIADGAGTKLVLTMTLPDEAAASSLMASGMSDGMEGCYKKLEKLEM